MNVACVSSTSYYRHIGSYVNPVVVQLWNEHQTQLWNTLSNMENDLVLAADGRCDSPGHCAKYGSFTFIEQQINRVVDFQLVQVHITYFNMLEVKNNNTKTYDWMD